MRSFSLLILKNGLSLNVFKGCKRSIFNMQAIEDLKSYFFSMEQYLKFNLNLNSIKKEIMLNAFILEKDIKKKAEFESLYYVTLELKEELDRFEKKNIQLFLQFKNYS